ncbi:hypothetical protein [Salinivibrio costicola]|jgi:hypothetical protein|uniref:hypothetical protein n=1 Tax=Salinivibrio costicola TaxID=51367 RepID=UPI000472BCE9|nr:hypothetical protein [Salinivibrio costicola]
MSDFTFFLQDIIVAQLAYPLVVAGMMLLCAWRLGTTGRYAITKLLFSLVCLVVLPIWCIFLVARKVIGDVVAECVDDEK